MSFQIVQKFGGTSVGSAAAIRRVGEIVARAAPQRPLVVVSAVGGVTSQIFRIVEHALARGDWERELGALVERHRAIVEELAIDPAPLQPLLKELGDLVRGIALIGESTARTSDLAASFGERLSARIVAAHLARMGVAARAIDAWDAGLVTDERFGEARPLARADASIRDALSNVQGTPVVTGYIGRDASGRVTTLGRGGSDYSAAIFGAALAVREIQIWTDVDGVMTADPRRVHSARPVEAMSYAEAAELAFFGAKVLHPATMAPAVKLCIPIRVLNTFRPEASGTRVVAKLASGERAVKSIATKDGIAAVNVVASAMMLQYGFLERIADAFARHRVVVDVIATSEVSVALTTEASARLDDVLAELSTFSEATVVRDLALISIVGEALRDDASVHAEALVTLRDARVKVEMLSYGATRNNLSLVVASRDLSRAVDALHDRLFAASITRAERETSGATHA